MPPESDRGPHDRHRSQGVQSPAPAAPIRCWTPVHHGSVRVVGGQSPCPGRASTLDKHERFEPAGIHLVYSAAQNRQRFGISSGSQGSERLDIGQIGSGRFATGNETELAAHHLQQIVDFADNCIVQQCKGIGILAEVPEQVLGAKGDAPDTERVIQRFEGGIRQQGFRHLTVASTKSKAGKQHRRFRRRIGVVRSAGEPFGGDDISHRHGLVRGGAQAGS